MRLSTAVRILSRDWLHPTLREHSWEKRLRLRRWLRLMRTPGVRGFAFRDRMRFTFRAVRPVRGQVEARARAAVDWLLLAQQSSPDAGVSLGYFPCTETPYGGWMPSYPETTGYIIPTLLECARRFERPDLRQAALAMAEWEAEIQMPSGAVQGGTVTTPEKQHAAAFNTGMVLHGWAAALEEEARESLERAARRAADWLVADLSPEGNFRTLGPLEAVGVRKTYTCLGSWGLYRLGNHTGESRYREAALRNIEATLRTQQPNGWFAENCLNDPDRPLTHTIGYTTQAILEVGLLADRADLVEAARRGIEPIVQRLRPDGFLHGRFFSDWEPGGFSSCLTGSAQIAVVCFRLYERLGDERYRAAADRLTDYLKALQDLDSEVPGVRGAIAGSHPFSASYMTHGFPNWATKYFLDALLLQERLSPAS